MKIGALIPAVLALTILVGAPFGFGPLCDTDPRGGLICYCCSEMGKNCTMISCSGCCGNHADPVPDRWSPEIIPKSFPQTTSFKVVYIDQPSLQIPDAVYLEVPKKPPNRV